MISYKYIVSDKQRLHATNAIGLSRVAARYENRITSTGTESIVDCRNIPTLMSLSAGQGESLELTVEGPDESQASGFLKGFMRTIL